MGNAVEYRVKKMRFGDNGNWHDYWEYSAIYNPQDHDKSLNTLHPGSTDKHKNIEDLASELSKYPGIGNAEFIPYNHRRGPGPRVSLGVIDDALTQYCTVTEEELGELGRLIQSKYKSHIQGLQKITS